MKRMTASAIVPAPPAVFVTSRRGGILCARPSRWHAGRFPPRASRGRSLQFLPHSGRLRSVKITRPEQTLLDTVIIAGLFAVWYLSNIYFNIYNKQVLNVFGHPGACTWIHLAVSSVLAIALWVVRVQPRPPLTPRVVDVIFPLAILHFLGFYTTNASLGAVNVSLTHTIKSMEPFFTVVFSWLLMKARPAKRVMAALIPVVGGVIVASATDLSFTWAGFIAAMLSNLAFQCRNVLSKKAMMRSSYESLESGGVDDISSLDEVNIFAVMSIMACVMMVPFVLALEGPALAQLGPSPMNWMSPDLWVKSILAGICRFGDVLASFLILQKAVIAASMIFFKTAASSANIAGTVVALTGVLLYSIAKRSAPTKMDLEAAIEETPLERALAAVSPGALYSRFFSPQPPTKVQANDENIEYFL